MKNKSFAILGITALVFLLFIGLYLGFSIAEDISQTTKDASLHFTNLSIETVNNAELNGFMTDEFIQAEKKLILKEPALKAVLISGANGVQFIFPAESPLLDFSSSDTPQIKTKSPLIKILAASISIKGARNSTITCLYDVSNPQHIFRYTRNAFLAILLITLFSLLILTCSRFTKISTVKKLSSHTNNEDNYNKTSSDDFFPDLDDDFYKQTKTTSLDASQDESTTEESEYEEDADNFSKIDYITNLEPSEEKKQPIQEESKDSLITDEQLQENIFLDKTEDSFLKDDFISSNVYDTYEDEEDDTTEYFDPTMSYQPEENKNVTYSDNYDPIEDPDFNPINIQNQALEKKDDDIFETTSTEQNIQNDSTVIETVATEETNKTEEIATENDFEESEEFIFDDYIYEDSIEDNNSENNFFDADFEDKLKPETKIEKEEEIKKTTAIKAEETTPKGLYSKITGISWQQYLEDRLNSELSRAAQNQEDLALVILRLQFLHRTDGIFRKIIARSVELFGYKDFVFEYGTDGIAIIVNGTTFPKIMQQTEQLYQEIFELFKENEYKNDVGIGISLRSSRLINADRLLTEAENACNKAINEQEMPIVAFKVDPERYRNYLAQK